LARKYGFVDQNDVAMDGLARELTITLPDNCRPNSYSANFVFTDTTSFCGDIVVPVEFDVYYSSSIMDPKFDNLIAVLDKEKNGGYDFISYQWYKNNELLEGEINGYLYLEEGGVFDGGDCYHLVLKRADDGVVMRTCEICPGEGTPVDDVYSFEPYVVNTIVRIGEEIVIANVDEAIVNIYTATGQLVDIQHITSGNNAIKVASLPGIYMLQVMTSTEIFTTKIIITE
jgi:hypothetical protein